VGRFQLCKAEVELGRSKHLTIHHAATFKAQQGVRQRICCDIFDDVMLLVAERVSAKQKEPTRDGINLYGTHEAQT